MIDWMIETIDSFQQAYRIPGYPNQGMKFPIAVSREPTQSEEKGTFSEGWGGQLKLTSRKRTQGKWFQRNHEPWVSMLSGMKRTQL